MGTRNLVAVVVDGDFKVAQYGQWDGYPGGTGLDVLNFLYGVDLDDFTAKVRALHWYTDDDVQAALDNIGAMDGMLNMEQSDEYEREYPELSRNTGSKILQLVAEGAVSAVRDSQDFALDSLFCEYAYVIDLDRQVLEIYEGFQKGDVSIMGRFADKQEKKDNEYRPVSLIKEYAIRELPSNEEFLNELEPEEEEED